MSKKFSIAFLGLLVIASQAWGQLATFEVAPTSSVGQAGQVIQFVVHVSTTEHIGALQFTLEYDANVATYQSVALHASMPAGFGITNVNTNVPAPGPYAAGTNENVLIQLSGNGINQYFTGEQDVAVMSFHFAPNVCKSSPIAFDPTCQRTHLATIDLVPICNPLLLSGRIATSCASDAPAPPEGRNILALDNVPNPFNPSTVIRYELAQEAYAQLWVFDITGRVVRLLHDGRATAGPHEVLWNGRNDAGQVLPSGVYYYQLVTPVASASRRTLLLK
jgi:hypothetical protein